MEKTERIIGKLLLMGLFLSLLLTIVGGALYLTKHGMEQISPTNLQSEPPLTLKEIWKRALTFSPPALIQSGLFILVITQLFRVVLTTWMFTKTKEKTLFSLSLFILALLIYSLFWHTNS